MTVTCLAFSGVIAEDGLDTQGLSVGPTAPIAGAWSWGRSELTARVPCRPLSTHSLARSMGSTRPPASAQRSRRDPSPVRHVPRRWPVPGADWRHGRQRVTIGWFGSSPQSRSTVCPSSTSTRSTPPTIRSLRRSPDSARSSKRCSRIRRSRRSLTSKRSAPQPRDRRTTTPWSSPSRRCSERTRPRSARSATRTRNGSPTW